MKSTEILFYLIEETLSPVCLYCDTTKSLLISRGHTSLLRYFMDSVVFQWTNCLDDYSKK